MRRVLFLPFSVALASLLAWLLSAGPSDSQFVGTTFVPLGYQQITTLSSATSLTVPSGARFAVIVAETQAVRYRDDGSAPTATVGMPLPVNTQLLYSGTLINLQFIEQTASAKLDVLYYR